MSADAPLDSPAPADAPAPAPGAAPDTPAPVPGSVAPLPTPALPSWDALKGSLPPELRDAAAIQGVNDFPSLVREHVGVQKLIGGDKIARPPEDASPEDLDRFWNALGRPQTPQGYDLEGFQPPEGMPWDANLQQGMVEDLHQLGLTQKQMNGALRAYAGRQSEQFQAGQMHAETARNESDTALRTAWGGAYDANVDLAGRAWGEAFGDKGSDIAAIQLPDGRALGDHPSIVMAFHKLGMRLSEHGLVGGRGAGEGIYTPQAAQSEIARLERDPEFSKAYLRTEHPDHEAANRRMNDLYRAANPEPTG